MYNVLNLESIIRTFKLFSALLAGLFTLLNVATSALYAQNSGQSPNTIIELRESLLILPGGYNHAFSKHQQTLIQKSAETYVRNNTRNILELLPLSQFKKDLKSKPSYEDRLDLAKGFITLGIDLFQKMDSAGSVRNLERGLEQFRELGHAFIAPDEVSNALLYLALTRQDESTDVGRILSLFKEMILTDTSIQLKKGLYPDNAVSFYNSARKELENDIRRGSPETMLVQKASLFSRSTYTASYTLLLNKSGSFKMILDVYEQGEARFKKRFSVDLSDVQDRTLSEAASRLMSRFITCLEEPSKRVSIPKKSTGKSPWSLQLSFAYTSYLTFPGPEDLEPFGNAGGLIGLSYAFTEEFALQGAFEILNSIRDRNGVISDNFQTLRIFAGNDIGIRFGVVKISIATFIEGAFLPEVKVCIPVDIRSRSGDCKNTVSKENFGAFLGVNLRPRISAKASESISVIAGANASFYLLPFTNSPINFPVSGELGLTYRF